MGVSNEFPCGVVTNANNIKNYIFFYEKVEFVEKWKVVWKKKVEGKGGILHKVERK